MKKKLWLILAMLALCTGMFALSVSAAEEVASGYCGGEGDGTNLTWVLYEDGELVISGTGAMKDWTSYSKTPWYSRKASIKTVRIGDSVTSIGERAFGYCSSLTSVTIPDSVTSIGENAFSCCTSLVSITVDANNPRYSSMDGVLFNKDKTTLINCPAKKSGVYTIPDSVTSIGSSAFEYCDSLTSVTIPDSVTYIGHYAFSDCASLTSVTIPDGVISIAYAAFSDCESLTSVVIPDSVTSIGENAFSCCTSLTSIKIPDSVTSIGENAFYNCDSLTSVTLPDSVKSIRTYAFNDCDSLTSIKIPDSVTSIGDYAFYSCYSLTSVTILTKYASFGQGVFRYTASGFTIHGYEGSTAKAYASRNGHNFVALHVCDFSNYSIITDATCTKEGVRARSCVCGDMIIESIPAIGHDFTYSTHVDKAHPHAVYDVCKCGEKQLTAASSDDATCTTCRPIQQMLASMTLGNELALNFFFYTSELGTSKDYTAVVTKYNGDDTTTEITVPYSQWSPNSTKYMKFTFNSISAKEMADKIEVRIYNGNGQLVSKVFEDSIKAYIMRKLPGWWGGDAVWAVEALNYGATAQLYFGYNTDDLANADLTDAQHALAPEMIDMPDISKNSVATLVLEENILLKLWFKRSYGADTTGMYAHVSFTNHSGKAVSYTLTADKLDVSNKNYIIVPIDTIAAADGNTAMTVTMYNADGTVAGTMVDSVISYASRKAASNELFEAVARFCTASYNYFH